MGVCITKISLFKVVHSIYYVCAQGEEEEGGRGEGEEEGEEEVTYSWHGTWRVCPDSCPLDEGSGMPSGSPFQQDHTPESSESFGSRQFKKCRPTATKCQTPLP